MPGPGINAGLDSGPAQLRAAAVPGPGFEEILSPLLRSTGPLTCCTRLDNPIATSMQPYFQLYRALISYMDLQKSFRSYKGPLKLARSRQAWA